jgi:predicted alpha/beta superfamily hydrolase
MKRNILIMAFLCLSFWVQGQPRTQPINIGHVDTVYSDILKEKRPILVYSPPFDTSYFSRPAYPVLYFFDGDSNFAFLMAMVRQLSAMNGNTIFPEMIIVGIPNTGNNRNRDLTPITNSSFDKSSGGGEKFTAFLEKELIPYIDKNYATAPYRTLIGHSLGGLMVINTLINHTSLFNAYLAIDPSMFYGNDVLLKQTDAVLQQKNFKGRSLFVAMANTMPPGMDTSRVRQDTTSITHHIRSILKFTDNLKKHPSNNLKWAYKYYPEDDHPSVPPIAEYDGLRFIFAKNKFPHNQPQPQYFDKAYTASNLKELIIAHYKLLSEEMGYQVKPSESLINMLGYTFLQQKDNERAFMFFDININYYPGSFNVYDSMGDYYLANNNKTNAITYFKKALAMKYRAEIKDKLDKLEKE